MSCILRFAPSPTGYLHVGNLKAALINALFAIKNNGTFLLRIDDTDQERSTLHYEEAIIEDLTWLGIKFNDTFRQSARFARYREKAEYLKSIGRLYPCYETPEELALKRKIQLGQKLPPKYDRAALNLTPEEIKQYEAEGRKPHWRFKLNHSKISWNDGIVGPIEFEGINLSDPVLIKEDDTPLYSFASVVDDMDYGITHIIRGNDHISNTATQIQMMEALGGNPQNIMFAHYPLLSDASGEGFSKRTGSLSLRSLREEGIHPMSLLGFIATLGTAMELKPYDNIEDLAKDFDMSKISHSSAKFSVDDLYEFNHKTLLHLPFREIAKHDPTITEEIWEIIKGSVNTLKDISDWNNRIFGDIKLEGVEEKDLIRKSYEILEQMNVKWDVEGIDLWLKQISNETGAKGKGLYKPIRMALTGLDHGPELKPLLALIPFDKIKQRLQDI